MSVDTAMGVEEARRKAEDSVRFELGTFVRVDSGSFDADTGVFEFPIIMRSPKIISNGSRDEVVDVRFYSELDLGTVTVDGRTGEVDRPNRTTVKKKVRDHEKEVEQIVQKALIGAAGKKFSHLPFPENQYSPLQDILAEILLQGDIPMAQIEMMDEGRENNRYHYYVEKLVSLDLLDRTERTLSSGSVLVDMYNEAETLQEALNAAMGRYFQHNVGEFKMIKRTLGPYLAIAGHYYRRALELETMPVVHESEVRKAIQAEYSGKRRDEKLMKLSRYLIQLEDIGILQSVPQNGETYWTGNESVRNDILQSEYMGSMQTLIAH